MSIFKYQIIQKITVVTVLCTVALTPIFAVPATAQAQATIAQQQQLLALYQQLFALQQQLNLLLQQQAQQQAGTGTSTIRPVHNPFFVDVTTGPALQIRRTAADVQVTTNKGGSQSLDVWVQYGTSNTLNRRSNVVEITQTGNRITTITLENLIPSSRYVYRVVAEDENGNRIYGQIRNFNTIAQSAPTTFTGRPVAETEGVSNVRATSARLQGFISMNDVQTGSAFFVYSTNRTQVSNATRYTTFNEIPTARNVTGKTMVNRTFTGRSTINGNASSLLRGTTYYYRVCVEYGDRNPTIHCGQIESFTTQN